MMLLELTASAVPVIDRMTAAAPDDWLRLAGRLHPLVVHFPLAFVVLAAIVEGVHACTRRDGVGPSVRLLLVAATIGAALAAGSGWMNAHHDWAGLDATWRAAGKPDGPNAADAAHLQWHRYGSLAFAAGIVLVTAGAVRTGEAGYGGLRIATRAGLVVVLGLALWTGHLGGELVHGRGHVLNALPAAAPPSPDREIPPAAIPIPMPTPAPAAGTVPRGRELGFGPLDLEAQARDILETHCMDCHGGETQKAGLRLVPLAAAFAWEAEFWTIVPGDADGSTVIKRVELPEGERHRMPPDGPGLSAEEIEALRAWIDGGALVDGRAPAEDSAGAN